MYVSKIFTILKNHEIPMQFMALFGHSWEEKAQLVQKNQPNESTVAKPHLATSSNDNSTEEYICVFMYYVLVYIILCIALHKKKNIASCCRALLLVNV